MRNKLYIFLFFVASLPAARETGIPFISNYAPRDYGASNQNWSITQDQNGFMYIANSKGVLEFDGTHWRLIPLANNAAALSITTAEDNSIFVGGKGEFGYLAADSVGQMIYHSLLPNLSLLDRDFGDVWEVIAIDRTIFFRSSEKLFRFIYPDSAYSSPIINSWTPKNNFHFSFNMNGTLLIRDRGHGLYILQGDSLRPLPGGELFADESVYAFLPIDDGSYLVVSRSKGFFQYTGNQFRPIDNAAARLIKQHRAIHTIRLSNGHYALATNIGVLFVNQQGEILHQVNKKSGLRDDTVWHLLQDKQGGVWCALNNGIARIELPSPLTLFDDRTNLDGTAQDIIRFDGRLYVASSPSGVFYLRHDANLDEPFAHFWPIGDIPTQSWQFEQVNNRLLVAATDGVYEISGARAKKIVPEQPGLDAACLFATHDNVNRIFVGLFDGLACLRLQDNTWIFEGRLDEINDEIRRIVQDRDGALWLGTRSNGIYRLFYTDFVGLTITDLEHFSVEAGLPPGQVFPFIVDDRLIITTENRGLYSFDETIKKFVPELGFGPQFSNGSIDVEIIAHNKAGTTLWFGSEETGRLDQLSKTENGLYQTKSNALQRLPTSAIRAIYPDTNNVLWISTNDGLFRYDATIDKNSQSSHRAFVRSVVLSSDSLLFAGAPAKNNMHPLVDHSLNSLRFEFSAVSYDAPGALLYQTRLDGFDADWSKWTAATSKEYTNLSQGDYTFHVRARDIYGAISGSDQFRFRITPPFYRSWWAYACYLLSFAAIAFTIDRLQRRRLLRRAQERTRVALLEAENHRKTEELEQARQLQVSMLPKELPQAPDANIAVFMKTATEVGGDYYDFILSDGEFVGAIGDATGHGLNAGMMVSIIKGFFVSEAASMSILHFFKKCNSALKLMNLNRIYMALTVFKIKDKKLTLSSAGMPPVYIYRSIKNTLEEISLNGMPLGAVSEFDYQLREIELHSRDTLFFMSDGFPELFNPDSEMIGYDRVPDILRDLADKPAQDIVTELVTFAKTWSQGRPNEDDITFVVLKIK